MREALLCLALLGWLAFELVRSCERHWLVCAKLARDWRRLQAVASDAGIAESCAQSAAHCSDRIPRPVRRWYLERAERAERFEVGPA